MVMYGDPLILVLVLALGSLSFFAGVVYVFCRMVAMIGRGFLRMFGLYVGPPRDADGIPDGVPRVCPRPQCRQIEYRRARFCGQCGARLMPSQQLR